MPPHHGGTWGGGNYTTKPNPAWGIGGWEAGLVQLTRLEDERSAVRHHFSHRIPQKSRLTADHIASANYPFRLSAHRATRHRWMAFCRSELKVCNSRWLARVHWIWEQINWYLRSCIGSARTWYPEGGLSLDRKSACGRCPISSHSKRLFSFVDNSVREIEPANIEWW